MRTCWDRFSSEPMPSMVICDQCSDICRLDGDELLTCGRCDRPLCHDCYYAEHKAGFCSRCTIEEEYDAE